MLPLEQPLYLLLRSILSLVDVRHLAAGGQMVILTLPFFKNREMRANYWRLIQPHPGRAAGAAARPQQQTTHLSH